MRRKADGSAEARWMLRPGWRELAFGVALLPLLLAPAAPGALKAWVQETTATGVTADYSADDSFFFVISGTAAPDGKVLVHRAAWQPGIWMPVTFGTGIGRSDMINVKGGAQVTLACSNGSTLTLSQAGLFNLQKRHAESAGTAPFSQRWRGERIAPALGGSADPDAVPAVVLSPRQSVRDDRPQVVWVPVPGARRYTVVFNGRRGLDAPERFVTAGRPVRGGTRLAAAYPTGAPSLKRGLAYTVSVLSRGTQQSATGDEAGEGAQEEGVLFQPLKAADAAATREKLQCFASLSEKVRPLLVAHTLIGATLYAEAAGELEALPTSLRDSLPVLVTLGDLYWKLGLDEQASAFYKRALSRAATASGGNANGVKVALPISTWRGPALFGMARATERRDTREAVALYRKALAEYQQFEGDQGKSAVAIRKRIAEIAG